MYPLPDGWCLPEVVSDAIVADGLRVHRAGVATSIPGGEEICGSAASATSPVLNRAWYELLERVATVEAIAGGRTAYEVRDANGTVLGTRAVQAVFPTSEAPDRWRYARSNGVALHHDWSAACERARWELVERDRVLRCWRGEFAPRAIALPKESLPTTTSYEWRAYDFSAVDLDPSGAVHVAGVFGFPEREDAPFLLGFAARTTPSEAVAAASAEAVQLLAFLWGEPLPDALSMASAPTAARHLDAFQVAGVHRLVRRWLEGGHARYAPSGSTRTLESSRGDALAFVDLTPPWLVGRFRVAKAVGGAELPLVFGESPWTEHLPSELRLHPVP